MIISVDVEALLDVVNGMTIDACDSFDLSIRLYEADTDEDWLVYAPGPMMQAAIAFLSNEGWKLDNPNEHYRPEEGVFNSWRKGEVNLIVTGDHSFRRRYLAATEVAKKLNLMEKRDRVLLFQAVLYGNGAATQIEQAAQ
eukprot:jgi/Tetstr1/450618/TSEL_037654.t1